MKIRQIAKENGERAARRIVNEMKKSGELNNYGMIKEIRSEIDTATIRMAVTDEIGEYSFYLGFKQQMQFELLDIMGVIVGGRK
jgi:hypothetical protein